MLTAVFGLPFGISINISIDNLRRDGYYIDGYNNNEVYLRNVYEMNYSWDDGVVIYDSSGRMQSARLYQSTYGYDSSRFDNLYSQICSQYGLPANTATERKQSLGMTATAATTCRLPTTT